jgi:hypothetical protein
MRPQWTCVCHFLHLQHIKDFSDSSHNQCMPTVDNSGIEPVLHRRGLQRTNLYSIDIWHQLHTQFLCPIHLLLLTLRKHVSLDGEFGGFTSLLPVLTAGLIGLLFPPERGPFFCFPFVAYCVSRKGTYDNLVSCFVGNFTPLFFSNSALYGEAVMMFAKPSADERGGGRGRPVQITGARLSGRGPGARIFCVCFCCTR